MRPDVLKDRSLPFGKTLRRELLALTLLAGLFAPGLPVRASDNGVPAATYESRAAVEKESRSRYRDLEISSLVLILLGGGAAIWWALKRK